LTFPKIRV